MKAISRHSLSMNSSLLNTCTYLARSSRLATAAKKDHTVQLDRTVKFRLGTDWMGRSVAWTDSEADRLQYYLAYSNSEQYCSEDLKSLARGREVTAENLEEEAASLQARASILTARADALQEQSVRYWCVRYHEDACTLLEEANWLEEEATRLLDTASDLRKQAEYFKYEAENVLKEDILISKWEEIYDMM